MKVEIDGIYYDLSSNENTATVTYGNSKYGSYSGTVVIPESVSYDGTTYNVTGIGSYAFNNCYSLTSISIPNSVTLIGHYAFCVCGLTSITIPESVTWIGNEAFCNCGGLTSVTIPGSVTSILRGAFSHCANLQSVCVSEGVINISDEAFMNSGNLSSITIPSTVKNIGSRAFQGTNWYDNQPEGLVYAGNVAYKYKGTMPEGTQIEIREGTLGITNGAFSGCTGLKSITIPNGVTSIPDYTFSGCSSLTSITIPESIISIANKAFKLCGSLTSIIIPNCVTSIGLQAFAWCTSLTSVLSKITEPFEIRLGYWIEDYEYVEENDFFNISSDCVLTVPIGTKDAYIAAGWTEEVFRGGIIEDGMEMSISSVGYATFFNIYGDLVIPEGVTAYIATVHNGSVSLDEIEGKIPVNTPVVLKGAAGTYDISYTTGATAIVTNNLQIATAPVTSDGTQYVLANRTSHGVGFYKVKAGTTIPAGKVYLQLPSSGIKDFFGFDEDDATGIETLSNSPLKDENIYNLAGQRINKMQRGINIINGKKVLK